MLTYLFLTRPRAKLPAKLWLQFQKTEGDGPRLTASMLLPPLRALSTPRRFSQPSCVLLLPGSLSSVQRWSDRRLYGTVSSPHSPCSSLLWFSQTEDPWGSPPSEDGVLHGLPRFAPCWLSFSSSSTPCSSGCWGLHLAFSFPGMLLIQSSHEPSLFFLRHLISLMKLSLKSSCHKKSTRSHKKLRS